MAPEFSELMGALPSDVREESPTCDALADLMSKLAYRPVPVGALTRLRSAGGVHAKIALAYLAYWVRTSFATRDDREKARNEAHLSAAIKLLAGMSYLRGAAMKIGQMLSNFPKIVPAEFSTALGQLHFDAPPMHFSLLRELVRNELGGDPEDVFDTFEKAAFAAASLGQVHRARLKTGERVAVKIQYPNIARTIRDDFRSLSALLLPMRLTRDWENIKAQFEDLRETLEMETDYAQEAAFLNRARSVFTKDDPIVIPRVHAAFSTRRVLTMDLIDGVHIDAFMTDGPSQEQRDRAGELIKMASFRLCCAARLWYSDAHPGNFLFLDDGRLGLIDFGCCRVFDDDEWSLMCQGMRGLRDGPAAMREAIVRGMDYDDVADVDPKTLALAEEWTQWIDACCLCAGPFDFGSDVYMERGIDILGRIARRRAFRSMPVNNWLFRSLLGTQALLHRLGARVDVGAILEREAQAFFA